MACEHVSENALAPFIQLFPPNGAGVGGEVRPPLGNGKQSLGSSPRACDAAYLLLKKLPNQGSDRRIVLSCIDLSISHEVLR